MVTYNTEQSIKSKEKILEKIKDDWTEFSGKPGEEAVANFRLNTQHIWLFRRTHQQNRDIG